MKICIYRVLHKTFISVAEQGTRAGAATAVEFVAEARHYGAGISGSDPGPALRLYAMTKWFFCLLTAALVLSSAACQAPSEPDPTNPHGGNGASRSISKEPPCCFHSRAAFHIPEFDLLYVIIYLRSWFTWDQLMALGVVP